MLTNAGSQHSQKARAWAAEVAQLKADLRVRDAQINDLHERMLQVCSVAAVACSVAAIIRVRDAQMDDLHERMLQVCEALSYLCMRP